MEYMAKKAQKKVLELGGGGGGFPFVWAGIRVAVKALIADSLLLVAVGCAG